MASKLYQQLAQLFAAERDERETKVPQTRTVAGKPLSTNVTLAASDVGAATASDITSAVGALTAADVDAVPLSRTIDGIPLSDHVTLPEATTSTAGKMSAADKVKLNGVATGATVNSTDAALRDRSSHTGQQAASTISDFGIAVDTRLGEAGALDDFSGASPQPVALLLVDGVPATFYTSGANASWAGLSLSQTAAENATAIEAVLAVAVARSLATSSVATVIIPESPTGAPFPVNPVTVTGTGVERIRVVCEGSLTSAVSNPANTQGILHFDTLKAASVDGADVTYTGDFDPATLAGKVCGVVFEDVDDVVASNIRVRGANLFGLRIDGAEQATVLGADTCDNRQAGTLIVSSENISVIGGQFHRNGKSGDTSTGYGLACPISTAGVEAKKLTIIGAFANDNFRKGFDLHSGREMILSSFQAHRNLIGGVFAMSTLSGSYAKNIKITDGIVSGVGSAAPIESYGVRVGGVAGTVSDDIEVDNVKVYDQATYGIWCTTGGVRRIRVSGCSIDGVPVRDGNAVSQGITISSDGDPELVEILDNTVKGARIAIQAVKGQVLDIRGNKLPIYSGDPHLDGVGTWAATTAYSEGDRVRGVTKKYGFYYECTTAGTSGGTEPTWATTGGGTVTDGTAVWTTVGVAPYDGFQLGNAGAGLGFDVLQMSGNFIEEGYERNHRSADNINRLCLLNNIRGSGASGYDMDPPPITLTAPYQSVTGASSTTLEMLTLPTQSYVRVVAAGGRQLSATRKLEVHVGGSARHTVTDTTWHEVHVEGHYSGSIVTVQLVLVNDGATVDMGGSVQVVVTRGVNL